MRGNIGRVARTNAFERRVAGDVDIDRCPHVRSSEIS